LKYVVKVGLSRSNVFILQEDFLNSVRIEIQVKAETCTSAYVLGKLLPPSVEVSAPVWNAVEGFSNNEKHEKSL